MQSNNTNLAASNENVFIALQMKADDVRTKEKASLWLPKAEQIKAISSGIMNYLDSLRVVVADSAKKNQQSVGEVFISNGVGKDIYLRLKKYKAEIFAVHPNLQYSLGETINRTLFNRDSLLSADEYQQKYFNDVNKQETISFLSLLQNKSLFVTNICLQWCHEQFTYHGYDFEAFETTVGQNAKVLEAGDELEITAGLGSFSRSKMPKITINNRLVPLNEKGIAVQKIKTGRKSGSYNLPVQVSFIDQDGKEQTHTFTVDYRLVKRIEN
jgi:hypothetical protein